MNIKILHHFASDALLAGHGNFVETKCFSGVRMLEQPKLAVLRHFETVLRRIIYQESRQTFS
jgi:hypothetical protein